MRISCPPIKYPCFYGIDFPTREELVASSRSIKEIQELIGVDSLGYISLEGLFSPFENQRDFCSACFTEKYPVEIKGYTDSRPAGEKSTGSNWEISALKALELMKFFLVIGEVPPSRLTAYGRGEYDPIESNDTRKLRAQNRRVEIFLEQSESGKLRDVYKKKTSGLVVFKRFVFSIFD